MLDAKTRAICPHCNKETNILLHFKELRICEHCKQPINKESEHLQDVMNWLHSLPADERETITEQAFINATSKVMAEFLIDERINIFNDRQERQERQ